MSTLQQLRTGVGNAWHNLADGWNELRQRASHAITHFKPGKSAGTATAADSLTPYTGSRWGFMAAEVNEDDKQIDVRLEIPGMDTDDFDIQVIDDILVIRGEKQVEREQNKGHYHIMECAYGSFERAIPLPAEVDSDKTSARYRRGVLEVTLPKSSQANSRRIEVGSA